MARYRSFRDLDWSLLALTLVICALGVLQIYSATRGTRYQDAWWKQLIYIALGMGLMWIVSTVDYHNLLGQVPLLYAVSLVLLGVTRLWGSVIFGARRWIRVFGFNFQASEFVKLVVILVIARYLSELKRDEVEPRDFLKLGLLVGLPAFIVLRQPDLGTALTYLPFLGVGILIAGISWRYLAIFAIVLALALPAAWFLVEPRLAPYQRARLMTFLDPGRDPRGAGYHVNQSRIAVGDGGMWGRGVTHGSQTQLHFLPVPHADFIISSFAEEHGFIGVSVVIGLYFLLLMQIVQNAQSAPDRAGMYICMGAATLMLFHLLVNLGMAVGNMPVTGIPLPLMSAGGSNIISMFMLLGLVHNVRLRRSVG